MKDLFEILLARLEKSNSINIFKRNIEKNYEVIKDFSLLGPKVNDEVKKVYETYNTFEIFWECTDSKQEGEIVFVPYCNLKKEHEKLCQICDVHIEEIGIELMNAINDIKHWYPIFKFPNGDAFCLDSRNNKIVFYEHEIYDTGENLHGLIIADSISELYDKWVKCLCVDVYDWSEVVNEHGIDLNNEVLKAAQKL